MSITTLDGYIASAKQKIPLCKTASLTSVGLGYFSYLALAGNPAAGSLTIGQTSNGVVPTDATTGYPVINAFGGSATGYLTGVEFSHSVAARMMIYDRLFNCGSYAYTAGTTTLSSQPAISGRCPDYPGSGTTFGNGNEIWVEVNAAFATGTAWTIQVTYTNHSGTTGRTSIVTPSLAAAALTAGRMYPIALQAGDCGVQKIESVIVVNGGTAMTAGSINVLILRRLWQGRVWVANNGDTHALDKTGMPVIYADSAIALAICPDSTTGGLPDCLIEVCNG
jgi:hypothetical protein